MHIKKIWVAVLVGIITGLLTAAIASYFIWQYATKCAYLLYEQEQKEKDPKREALLRVSQSLACFEAHEEDTPRTINNSPEPPITNVSFATATQSNNAEAESSEKTNTPKSSLPQEQASALKKKSRRNNRRRKKVVSETIETVVTPQEISNSIDT